MKKYKHGELTRELLKGLIVGGFIITCFALPGAAQIATLFNAKNAGERYRVKQAISGLARKKFVRIYEKNGKDIVEITELGKRRILEFALDDMKIKKQSRWDGFWRVVIFDIPEQKKVVRNALNQKMKEMDMRPIQKSTFISPYPCKNEIDFLGEYYNIRKHIIYMKVKEIEGAGRLTKVFGL